MDWFDILKTDDIDWEEILSALEKTNPKAAKMLRHSLNRDEPEENENARIARQIMESMEEDDDEEEGLYDECCERSRKKMEEIMLSYTNIDLEHVINSAKWKGFTCSQLRRELELYVDMGMPVMDEILAAWDKCAELVNQGGGQA